jgi:hypothetical protein
MTTAAIPATATGLRSYLQVCGGSDRFEFHDFRGDPDPLAARAFAEGARERFHDLLGHALTVEQKAHRVTLTICD